MRVLVILRAAWRRDNNSGNTMTDFFAGMPDCSVYSLCMREQLPDNPVALRNFAISEQQLVRNVLHPARIGKETGTAQVGTEQSAETAREEKVYASAKQTQSVLLRIARECVWMLGTWKNEKLRAYLRAIQPDVIFMPVFNCFYPFKILQYAKRVTGARVVLFHADDNYTLRQFSLNPLYWLYRFRLRHHVRKAVRGAALNYVISDVQKRDYEKVLGVPCKVLTKSADFSGEPPVKTQYHDPMQIVFTGNIGTNRWKSLARIAKALETVNRDGVRAELRIYTATPVTHKMREELDVDGSSFLMGSVPASEILRIQSDADILVHVEALDLKNRLAVRQSFSTKLVDYFKAARPILAVGPHDVASIAHLIENDCALVAETVEQIEAALEAVLADSDKLDDFSEKAYACGRAHHDKAVMQQMLQADLNRVIKEGWA